MTMMMIIKTANGLSSVVVVIMHVQSYEIRI